MVSALPTGGAPHAILRSRQKRQAIAGLRRALRFVDGNFNTPCPAFGLGTSVACGSDDDVATVSMRFTPDVGVPVSDENDDETGVPGEYESGPGMDRDGGGGCLYTWLSMSKLSRDRNEPWVAQIPGMRRGFRRGSLALHGTNPSCIVDGDGGNRGHAEETTGVALTSYQRDVALALPPLCMA